jgi:hypothetical protein
LAVRQLEDRAVPTVFVVPNGDVNADSHGLVTAIKDANADGQVDTIVLAQHGSYPVTQADNNTNGNNALPVITSPSLTIRGSGARLAGPGGVNPIPVRFFYLDPGARLTIQNLSMGSAQAAGTAADARGGAIYNQGGDLTLDNVLLELNTVNGNGGGAQGGGIYSTGGHLLLVKTQLIGNTASALSGPVAASVAGNAEGGGIFLKGGQAILIDTTLSGNQARGQHETYDVGGHTATGGLAAGGGIYATATQLTLLDTTLKQNAALGGGGANSVVGNGASGASGTPGTYRNRGNGAGGKGGAGGNAQAGGNGGQGAPGQGGGLYVTKTTLTVNGTTLTLNTAEGGPGGSARGGSGGRGGPGGSGAQGTSRHVTGGTGGNGGLGGRDQHRGVRHPHLRRGRSADTHGRALGARQRVSADPGHHRRGDRRHRPGHGQEGQSNAEVAGRLLRQNHHHQRRHDEHQRVIRRPLARPTFGGDGGGGVGDDRRQHTPEAPHRLHEHGRAVRPHPDRRPRQSGGRAVDGAASYFQRSVEYRDRVRSQRVQRPVRQLTGDTLPRTRRGSYSGVQP